MPCVAIGSNLDDPAARVLEAFDRLAALGDCRLELRSRLYRSHPLGPQDQPDFVNAVAGMLTTLAARALLDALLEVEQGMGRRRDARWGPRIIDLDLLWMLGPPIDEPGLRVPHPALSARNFVLYPLADVCPLLTIPGLGRVCDLKNRVSDAGLSVLGQAL
jgi:2-amino-4-hydroxy-6-hydroxymethyldihydropteridine diphosphokinase